MTKAKLCSVMAVMGLMVLPLGACAGEPGPAVTGAAGARDVALVYLQEREVQPAPGIDLVWQEEDITPPGLFGAVHKEFASDEWTVKVWYPVVPPESGVYQVVVSSAELGWHWKGRVEADGSVTELGAFRQMSEEESRRIAEEYLRNSPTFVFDGMEETLILADTLTTQHPYSWIFVFEFDSRHAGYGDRTGQILA